MTEHSLLAHFDKYLLLKIKQADNVKEQHAYQKMHRYLTRLTKKYIGE